MSNHAIEDARSWSEQISRFVLGINEDSWDRLEELREECRPDDADELAKLEAMAEEFKDGEDALEQAQESILSIELEGTWVPGETPSASRYIITLTTGGPACRIIGNLDHHGQPCSATMEWQDWGTYWTEFHSDADLLAFASIFYFGE